MIAALAGRRIDGAGARPERFPSRLRDVIGIRIEDALRSAEVETLVCAAACGVDLLALSAAERLGIRMRVVLPFAAATFRQTSVVDRGEEWGPLFDRLVAAAAARGDLHDLGLDAQTPHVYERANAAILDDARALAGDDVRHVVALTVWDGPLTGRVDHTADFARGARERGIASLSIPILAGG